MVYFTSLPSDVVEHLALSALKRFVPVLGNLPYEHNEGRSDAAGLPAAPDFVMRGDTRLGIEVSEVVRSDQGATERASVAMRSRVVAAATKLAQQRGHAPMTVSVHFREVRLSKPRAIALVDELVDLVESLMPEVGERVRLVEGYRGRLPAEVANVTIDRSQFYIRVRWQCPEAWWVSRTGPAAVQSSIKRKAGKIAGYLRHCDDCWLLLWVQAGTEAGAIVLDDDLLHAPYESPFGRTFLWDAWGDRVHELCHRDLCQT